MNASILIDPAGSSSKQARLWLLGNEQHWQTEWNSCSQKAQEVVSRMLHLNSQMVLPSNPSLLWQEKNGDLPDMEEEMEIQPDCHRSLKLLFVFPHKLFTFYNYLCFLSVYKAQHSESWATALDFCATWLWHLNTCPGYLETYFSLNSWGSLATCDAINTRWKALIENFWMQDQGKTKENLDISAEAFFGQVGF